MITEKQVEILDPKMFISYSVENLFEHNNFERRNISGPETFDWSTASISVRKITEEGIMQEAFRCTSAGSDDFTVSEHFAYESAHSPERTQWFLITMRDIPNFASIHYVRHDKFAYHFENFVKTGREDRGGLGKGEHRYSKKNHIIVVNAAELKAMAWARLCQKAHPDVRYIMAVITELVRKISPDLADKMVPYCVAHGRCKEDRLSCNKINLMYKEYAPSFYKKIKPECLPKDRSGYVG